MVWIFANPIDIFLKWVPVHSSVPQGTILFKLSSQISPKYVTTLITNKRGFYLSLGVDAIILVKYLQYFKQLSAIFGGIKPNHCIYVSKNTGEDIIAIMRECIEVNYGYMADKVEVAVRYLHNPPNV